MVGLLKVVGGLVIAVAAVFAVVGLVTGGIVAFVAGVVSALSYAFWGAVIFTFGLMLEHLEAIRWESARQSEMLTELLQGARKADPSLRPSKTNSIDQLAKSNFKFGDI